MKKLCVLAYSGGLDTSAIIPWLKDNFDFEVIAYCCNLGNLPPKSELRDRALQLGAKEFIYEDAQAEFVSDYVFPMLRGGATYFEDYLLGTAIARPLIAKKVAAFAKSRGAKCIAHGATGKGNDHIRFEKSWAFLCPDIEIIAPWKIWSYRSREELIAFLATKNCNWNEGKKTYSVDVNNFHRSCEGGDLENIETPYSPLEVQKWIPVVNSSGSCEIQLQIQDGQIAKLNGKACEPKEILESLNTYGSSYGIGICDIVEERTNGIKSRGIYETPGGTIAHVALKALKQICWSRELYLLSQTMSTQYGRLIYDGDWFNDTRQAVDCFFKAAGQKLSGEVTLQLAEGKARVLARKSPYSLYRPNVVSFESDSLDIHRASLGYTKILTLSALIQGQRERSAD
jgi:argininosuccinate synthase